MLAYRLILPLALVLALTTSSFAQPGTPVRGGQLNVGLDIDFLKFDPVNTGWATVPFFAIYDSLVLKHPETGQILPHLAESWKVSPDLRTFMFKLRPGVKFHNGKPFTAKEAAWFFETVRDRKSGHPWAFWFDLESATAPDDLTLVLKSKQPDPNLLDHAAHIYSGFPDPATRQQLGERYGQATAVGTGPFRFVEWVAGDRVVVDRVPDYQRRPVPYPKNHGPAYLDRIVYRYIADPAQRAIELEAGKVQLATGLQIQDILRLRSRSDLDIVTAPTPNLFFIGTNLDRPALKDVRVRQAMYIAIDREAIVKAVFGGLATPVYGWLTPVDPEYYRDAEKRYPRRDLTRAKALLAEAGWKDVELTLIGYTDPIHKQVMEIVQEQLGQIGMRVRVETVDRATALQRRIDGTMDLWLFMYYSQLGTDVAPIFVGPSIPRPNSNRWRNQTAWDLIAQAAHATTVEERRQKWTEIQKIVLEEVPVIPIATQLAVWGVRKEVRGFVPSRYGALYVNDIWLAK